MPSFFFFNDTATTEIYTLSLHDALPISFAESLTEFSNLAGAKNQHGNKGNHQQFRKTKFTQHRKDRSEEHTSELQSHSDLVCRLLLEKKKHLRSIPSERRNNQRPETQHD